MQSAERNAPMGGLPTLPMLARLPRAPRDYLRSPIETFHKLVEWFNARRRLRSCNRVGAWTRVTGKVVVANQGQMILGERVQLHGHYAPTVLVTFPAGRLEIGDRSVINYGGDISATSLVRIGADCLVGTHVIILDNDFHDVVVRDRVPESRPVVIGDSVWIGNRATILPGVTIGDGAAVGAGSVVMTDVPPRSLVMGNPARVIKKF